MIIFMNYSKCVRLHKQYDAKRKHMGMLQSRSYYAGRRFNTLISKRKRVYIGGTNA